LVETRFGGIGGFLPKTSKLSFRHELFCEVTDPNYRTVF